MALRAFISPRIEPVLTFERSLNEKLPMPRRPLNSTPPGRSFTLGFTFQVRKSWAASPWSFCAHTPEFRLGFHTGSLSCTLGFLL